MRFRTVATSEFVVPRSMPTASLCSRRCRLFGFGDLEERHQPSTVASIASMSATTFVRKRSSRTGPRAVSPLPGIEKRGDARFDRRGFGAHVVEYLLEVGDAATRGGVGRGLAPFELPFEEVEGKPACPSRRMRRRRGATAGSGLARPGLSAHDTLR
jgi:hypothetical protein